MGVCQNLCCHCLAVSHFELAVWRCPGPSVLEVLQRIRQSPGHMGVDIGTVLRGSPGSFGALLSCLGLWPKGGSLVKMAIALPFSASWQHVSLYKTMFR